MKELSYHILDIANNSIRANANHLIINIDENREKNALKISINDNGNGIPAHIYKDIKNPFTTSRTTRKVGLGIPLLNDTCLNCNGHLNIDTEVGKGTQLEALMELTHIDRPPMGNLVSTILTLFVSHEDINIDFIYEVDGTSFTLTTQMLKEILGDISLNTPEISQWIREYLKDNIVALHDSE
jgi:signal transduction histidine kinase